MIKDGEVIVTLTGKDGQASARQSFGATSADIRKSLAIVGAGRAFLVAKWQEMHGGTD